MFPQRHRSALISSPMRTNISLENRRTRYFQRRTVRQQLHLRRHIAEKKNQLGNPFDTDGEFYLACYIPVYNVYGIIIAMKLLTLYHTRLKITAPIYRFGDKILELKLYSIIHISLVSYYKNIPGRLLLCGKNVCRKCYSNIHVLRLLLLYQVYECSVAPWCNTQNRKLIVPVLISGVNSSSITGVRLLLAHYRCCIGCPPTSHSRYKHQVPGINHHRYILQGGYSRTKKLAPGIYVQM